jgi:hypothetical protein
MVKVYANNMKEGGHDELMASFTYALHAGRYADDLQSRMPHHQIAVKEGKREWRKGPFTKANELAVK